MKECTMLFNIYTDKQSSSIRLPTVMSQPSDMFTCSHTIFTVETRVFLVQYLVVIRMRPTGISIVQYNRYLRILQQSAEAYAPLRYKNKHYFKLGTRFYLLKSFICSPASSSFCYNFFVRELFLRNQLTIARKIDERNYVLIFFFTTQSSANSSTFKR